MSEAPAPPAGVASPPDASTDDENTRWTRQFRVTLGLLTGFAVLVVAMIWIAGGDDIVWQRRVYVFGAVEAIVFTAIGWLFGREVNRTAAVTAQADAETAKQEAAAARIEARDEASRAAEAGLTAAEADAKLQAIQAAAHSAAPSSPGGPRDVGARSHDGGAIDLRKFIDELLSPGR